MDRSRYSNVPGRDPPKQWSSQDARSGTTARPASDLAIQPASLAIQPAANPTSLKLKKKAVKIIAHSTSASAESSVTSRAATPTAASTPGFLAPATTVAPVLVPKASPTTETPQREVGLIKELKNGGAKATAALTEPEPETMTIPIPEFDPASSLEELFARLSARSPTSTSPKASPDHRTLTMFSFDKGEVSAGRLLKDLPETNIMFEKSEESQTSGQYDMEISPTPLLNIPIVTSDATGEAFNNTSSLLETKSIEATSAFPRELTDIEREYLRKASEYVGALPTSNNTHGHLFKTVSGKLHSTYPPKVKLDPKETDRLKARYAFAIINFINQNVNSNTMPLTVHKVKDMLQCNDGNFLILCATLIEEKYMTLESLENVVGLCKILLDVLPKAIDSSENPKSPDDPMGQTKLWPAPEKRKAATYRTCNLKGVSGLALSDLTPLIWGGALESLVIPPASDIAIVKFLTPNACTTYLDATSNGIVIPADPSKPPAPRKLVFVEPQSSPNSINVVIQSCIDAEQTRCVRALGADDDWSDAALMKLAVGTDKAAKRDVERIKKGKNVKGVYMIEFRFGNIYHALSFRRQLMADEAWEHCHLQFARDPCEMASGVHMEDAE